METHCIYELQTVRCTDRDGQITNRTVKFHILETSDYNGKAFVVKTMDELDPRFLFQDRLNAMKFQPVAQDLELNFEFDKFGDYLEDLLKSVPDNQHRFCEINSEDVPHLIVKDSSDMWKTNTLLKLPLQKAEDDELMVHMVDLCTERKKKIEDLTLENNSVNRKWKETIQSCEKLNQEFHDAKTKGLHDLEVLRHEHALKCSEINREHEAQQREIYMKQDSLREELNRSQGFLSDTQRQLDDSKDETNNFKKKLEEKKKEMAEEGLRNSELSKKNEALETQCKALTEKRVDLESQIEKLKTQKRELDHFKHQSRQVENELTNEKMRLQHANECYLREVAQLKAELEKYKEYKQHAESRSAEIERMKAEQTSLATQLSDTRKKYDSMQDEWREKEIQHMKLTTEYEFLQKEREKLKEDYEKQQQTLDEFLKQQQYPYPSVNAFLPPTPRMYSTPSSSALDRYGSESSFKLDTNFLQDTSIKHGFTSSAPNLPTYDFHEKKDPTVPLSSPANFSWMREFGT